MTRVLGLVPARGGSKRLPGKNLRRLGGRTLVRRALDTTLAAQRIDTVVLSSEDDEILREARSTGALALRRPAELSTDSARSYDVALHALHETEARLDETFDVLALVQCTTPFATPADLNGALELLERSGAASVVTVAPAPDLAHPLKLKRLEGDQLVPYLEDDALTPSHELPELWVRNGALYASRREILEQRGTLVAEDVLGFRMPVERSLDVNAPLDLAFAEFLLSREGHA